MLNSDACNRLKPIAGSGSPTDQHAFLSRVPVKHTFRLSISTAEESSIAGGPWAAQVPLGALGWCQLLSEDDDVAGR